MSVLLASAESLREHLNIQGFSILISEMLIQEVLRNMGAGNF